MSLRFQKDIDNFAVKAESFCKWVESELSDSFDELQRAEELLAELHLAVLRMPESNVVWNEVENLAEFEEDKNKLKADWSKCRSKFEKLPVNGYWEIFDASDMENKNSVYQELSDDLADIYSDLKIGLLLYQNEMFAEAFWEWRFNFQIHWGNHLVGAQKAIRNYISFRTEI